MKKDCHDYALVKCHIQCTHVQRQFQSCQVTQAADTRDRAAMLQLSFCAKQ